jgi:uncharacterized OB-fold protein
MSSTGSPPPASNVPTMIGVFDIRDGDLHAPFWEGIAAHELRLQQCAGCGTWIWGPQWRCGSCGSFELAWPTVEPRGEVFSWTRTWHPVAPEVAADVPYTVALVALPACGQRRLLGIWTEGRDPVLGEAVAVRWPGADERRSNPYALLWEPAP